MSFQRVIIVILDACGVGELPDADNYGDRGSATLPNIARAVGGLYIPSLQSIGLGRVANIQGVHQDKDLIGAYGRMAEQSAGKDSTSGHWEIAGIILTSPFPTYPKGFPQVLVHTFEEKAGVKTIGNKAISGTEIIAELGPKHLQTGALILYTSADSVWQMAAHEEIVPVDKLYEYCKIARKLLTGEHAVGRVIARPFTGTRGNYMRTAGRKDFSLLPIQTTVLDLIQQSGRTVYSIGKINDLFADQGIDSTIKTANNDEVMDSLIEAVCNNTADSVIFANCVDFDEKWGHRNDEIGFANGLEQFDKRLTQLLEKLRQDDLLIITADHGCDPTIKTSTDHSREYVPLLVVGPQVKRGINLGTRETFSDIACTIADIFDLQHTFSGQSFLNEISGGA